MSNTTDVLEGQIQRQIIREATSRGFLVQRINSGITNGIAWNRWLPPDDFEYSDAERATIAIRPGGQASGAWDLILVRSDVILYVECKLAGGTLSDAQKVFGRVLRHVGVLHVVASSWGDVQAAYTRDDGGRSDSESWATMGGPL